MAEAEESPIGLSERTKKKRCAAACETCKRRKERCDAAKPCGRCVERGVATQCYFVERSGAPKQKARRESRSHDVHSVRKLSEHESRSEYEAIVQPPSPPASESLQTSRLIQDQKGSYMFIGDSANLSFLQTIRRLVGDNIGPCAFVDDPMRTFMVEASPKASRGWMTNASQQEPPVVSLEEARYLLEHYHWATNCLLDLFDYGELVDQLAPWCLGLPCSIPEPIYYLVLAIGAQTCPEDKDATAAALFTHGRFLAAQSFMDDPSISTIQSYSLITFYLLGSCRRNAAFMHLGIAVRAAYALGLHRKDVASSLPPEQFNTRERLWKVIRILDLFMSASLGRPPSTSETRNTEAAYDYSASIDLCAIFEKILTDIYSRRMISTDALTEIGAHHRRWASRFFKGLDKDKVQAQEELAEQSMPNIGLLHVKEAYYWAIMLLTRPFLMESITAHSKKSNTARTSQVPEPCTVKDSRRLLVHACVDSAIRTVELLEALKNYRTVPKRLPFFVNSLFVSALVLGVAYFGDLYQTFPLQRNLESAQQLLASFTFDPIAQRNATIVGFLLDAGKTHAEKISAQNMEYQSLAIGSMFGQIHRPTSRAPTRAPTRRASPSHTVEPPPAEEAKSDEALPGKAVKDIDDELLLDGAEFQYDFEAALEAGDVPFPELSPQEIWFGAFQENDLLFSTIGSTEAF